ncbi:TonB-dependent receptor [Acetobacter persici]|uniref:TonB-dependent receptor n=1 Tax=Acetobacter persici TaxID=1076596 RepID=UPI0039EA51AD
MLKIKILQAAVLITAADVFLFQANSLAASAKRGKLTEQTNPAKSPVNRPAGNPSAKLKSQALNSTSVESLSVQGAAARGGGMIRREIAPVSTQTVTKAYIRMQSPTSTALDLIKYLPSVSVQNFDSSGMRGGNILSRSLTDNDMAITLDGVPASSSQYLANNVDSENIQSVTITPATVAIDLPVTTAAAGVMDEKTITPGSKFGGMTDFSYGTNNLSREFIRVNTGDIGRNGPQAYVSFSHAFARNWNGPGTADRKHIDFGLAKNFDNGSTFNLFLSWNKQSNIWYASIGEQAFYEQKNGRAYTNYNYVKDYNLKNASRYYKYAAYDQNSVFLSAPLHIILTKKVSFDLTPYFFDLKSSGSHGGTLTGGAVYYGTDPVSVVLGDSAPLGKGQISGYNSPWNSDNPNVGAVAKVGIDIDRHNHFEMGYWYNFTTANTVETLGGVTTNGGSTGINYYIAGGPQNGKALRNRDNDAGYETHALFIRETAKYFNDRLVVSGGFKLAMINQWAHNRITDSRNGGNFVVPLPQISATYVINNHHQVYVNGSGDFRLPDASNLLLTYGLQNGQISGAPSLAKPQYAIKEELGYRYNNKYVMFDLSLFNYSITNRLLSVTNFVDGAQISQTINAGNQTARGFDAMIATPPFHHFSPYASIEYLWASEDSNIPSRGDLLPTRGKRPVQAPSVMANFGLTYDDGRIFGNVGIHYTSSQFVTFTNDQKIPGYITDSLALGYRFPSFRYVKNPVFKLNFNNITGAFVRTGALSIRSNYLATTGLYGSPIPSAGSASFYLMPRFNMTGSLSIEF